MSSGHNGFEQVLHSGDRGLDPASRTVPHEDELAVRSHHATDLRQSTIVSEPVERFGAEHRVHRLIGEWNGFGGAGDQNRLWTNCGQPATHLRVRLNREHLGVILYEEARQLARSRAKFKYRRRARRIENTNRRRWITRPTAFVVLVPP